MASIQIDGAIIFKGHDIKNQTVTKNSYQIIRVSNVRKTKSSWIWSKELFK